MPAAKCGYRIDDGLQPFGDEGLQHMALNGQPLNSRKRHHLPGGTRDRHGSLRGADIAARRFYANDPLFLAQEANYLAILDEINAPRVRRPRISPCHRIMPRSARAPLHQSALDRKTRRAAHVDAGQGACHLLLAEQFRVNPVQPHLVAAPGEPVHLRG